MTALHVLFKVADADYVVSASDVLFMESWGSDPRPGRLFVLAGIVQIRGQVVPVVNLRARFRLRQDRTIDSRVIVVRDAERAVGLLINGAAAIPRRRRLLLSSQQNRTRRHDRRILVRYTKQFVLIITNCQ